MGEDPSDIHLIYIGATGCCGRRSRNIQNAEVRSRRPLPLSWGVWADFAGGFWGVHGFSVDQDGNFYTAEVDSGRVQKFRPRAGAEPGVLSRQASLLSLEVID